MDAPFQKDMSHVSWEEVFARQMQRADLVGEWIDALGLKAGDHVLEVGAGPGAISLILAERVGTDGLVYAVDRAPEAVDYLGRLQEQRGIRQIRRIAADAARLAPTDLAPNSALVTMVLHHADDPPAILRNLARLLPGGALALIGEFDPQGPREHGPPLNHRLRAELVQAWCRTAGFAVLECRRQTPDHYMLLLRRVP